MYDAKLALARWDPRTAVAKRYEAMNFNELAFKHVFDHVFYHAFYPLCIVCSGFHHVSSFRTKQQQHKKQLGFIIVLSCVHSFSV